MMSVVKKNVLVGLLSFALGLTLCVVVNEAKAKVAPTPKLLSMNRTNMAQTPDEMFEYLIPFGDLAPMHKSMMMRYQTYLIQHLSKTQKHNVYQYSVIRKGVAEESKPGEMDFLYEVYRDSTWCDLAIVKIKTNGNYQIYYGDCY